MGRKAKQPLVSINTTPLNLKSTKGMMKPRGYRSGRRRNRYSRMINSPFAIRTFRTLRYCQQISINPASGTAGYYTFRANSLYDPDYTGTGHQPLYFDQLMSIYNHYQVFGAKITFKVFNSTNTTPYVMGIKLDDSSTIAGSLNTAEAILEQNRVLRKLVSNPANATGRDTQCTMYFNAPKFFGIDRKAFAGNPIYRGNDSNNPQEDAYFQCFIAPTNGLADLQAFDCQVEITFYSMFSEPKDIAQS